MNVNKISLRNYRSYEEAVITPCEGITVFFGDNAQGKTNILEAVYLLSTGRAHRTIHDSELIRYGETTARVAAGVTRRDGTHDVAIALSSCEKRKVTVMGKQVSRSGELMGHVTSVLFSPEDLRIVKDGPAERRRFVDMELSQIKPSYYYNLQKYMRALKQRNALLKTGSASGDMLDLYDEMLASAAMVIMQQRACFITSIDRTAKETHLMVSNGKEQLSVQYKPSFPIDSDAAAILKKLRENRDNDIRRQTTGLGPHRDDVNLMLNDTDVRTFGSQGQQRTAALSMKLSELQVMHDEMNEWPLLMLDDVMSELDPNRRRLLLKHLNGVQTFVTCTDIEDLANADIGLAFRVNNSQLTIME